MIQHTNPRSSSVAAAQQQLHPISDGPEQWGQWAGRKHYSLEVVQHPLRARMCGFGDKDRRPLAPAAVAKMIVRRDDNTFVDVDDVDCSFFLVTVDLWSADGKQEMNLVLHPSSTDRYVPPHSSNKSKRRGNSSSGQPRTSGNQTPAGRVTPTPSQYKQGEQPSAGVATPIAQHSSNYANQSYYPPSAPIPDTLSFSQSATYTTPSSETSPTWGYPPQTPSVERNNNFPLPSLPSIHSLGRSSVPASSETWNSEGDQEILPYRAWSTDASYHTVDHYSNSQVDPSLRNSSNTEGRENASWSHQDTYASAPPGPQVDQPVYASAPYAPQPTPYHPVPYSQAIQNPSAVTPSGNNQPPPRHTYTRTLVGPLSANACRLLDEHRKPGIFFLFQDLSVRTEGVFRLRLRLMNVGAPPAPESGAMRVHNDMSPVLAQTFTEQFTVFSAKRFPGVPDTTALSIAFGNQGQKLPLRNRHGSKRRRRGESESDDDSDGG